MSESRDPKEVVEMREALVAFRKAARGVKKSHPGFPRISTRLNRVVVPDDDGRVDDTTKKTLIPA